MWIWSISIPSERERRAASFIRSFLDCFSHTYEVPLLSGNLSWHVKFHTEITHQFTFSPKVDMSQLMSQTTRVSNSAFTYPIHTLFIFSYCFFPSAVLYSLASP